VHRLKGEAGLLGLAPFELALHRVEDGLRVKDDIRVKENLRRDDGGSTLGAALLDLESLRRDAAELIERFGRLAFNQRPRERESRHADAGDVASQTAPATWPALWRDLDRLAQRVAADLGKRVRVCAAVEGGAPPPSWREPLRDVLVQLLRNAVAHGVEAPAERERAGKPAEGLVQVALRRHPDAGAGPGAATGWLELIVQDDGRGVDAGAVRRRAEQLGIPAPAGGEWSELLFHPGFSTAEVPHLHAGRGVGLDTVRDLVAARGGRVELHSEPGRFCAARVLVPLGAPVVPSRAVPA
jgi:chemotaxis protein histidine kinase CheA